MERVKDRKIVLENGMEFYGVGFGEHRDAICELVFNTSMVGYQEISSDPSYTDQMIVMSYPLIGNYGVTDDDYESSAVMCGGMVVRECCEQPSNFRYTKTLSEIFEENHVPGISEIDTRQLVRIIRDGGSCKAMITDADTPLDEALSALRAYEMPKDAVARVSTKKRYYRRTAKHKYNVVAVDCGIKLNILRMLVRYGCNVTIVPYNTTAQEIRALHPDGILLSNGPGDPENVQPTIDLVREIRGEYPLFGICLGHQIVSLAYGARTFKLKFGHRGGNHPVKNLETGKIEITSQNHSYAVDPESVKGTGLEITAVNLLDGTVEGVKCEKDRLFTVQYHPESAPGPQDSSHLFSQFIRMMEEEKANAKKN